MLFPYLESVGLGLGEMLGFFALSYLVQFCMLLPLKKLAPEKVLVLGMLSTALAYFLLALIGGILGLGLWIVFAGASFVLFWVPFNALWFEHKKWGNAVSGAAYYAIIFTIGIIGPMAAGLLVAETSYSTLFYASSIVLILGAFLGMGIGEKKGIKEKALGYGRGLEAVSGFKTLLLLEGIGMIGAQVVMFLITLEYFSEPLGFGLFLGSTTLVAVVISLVFAKISDEKHKRREFILLTSAGFGAAFILGAFAHEVVFWFIAVVLISFFRSVFPPFPMALIADTKKDIQAAMYGRELVFSFGRGMFLVLCMLLYYALGDLRIPLALSGVAMIAYPVVFDKFKRKKLGLA